MRIGIFISLCLFYHHGISTTPNHDQIDVQGYNAEDFSWFTEQHNLVSAEQMRLSNEIEKIHPQQSQSKKDGTNTIRVQRKRKTKGVNSANLKFIVARRKKIEEDMVKAQERLQEARQTGIGSLKETETKVNTKMKRRRQNYQIRKKDVEKYESMKAKKREKEKARRAGLSKEEKQALMTRQKQEKMPKGDG